jgi:hypothetical protein
MLHELRGFRHVFRHGYGIDLEPTRLQDLWQRWLSQSAAVRGALESFAAELSALAK